MVEIDKLKHYVVGSVIAAVGVWLIGLWAIVVVLVVAIGKEVYDSRTEGHVADWRDSVATVIGGVVSVVAYLA